MQNYTGLHNNNCLHAGFDLYYAISHQQSAGTDKAAVDSYSWSFNSHKLQTG